MNKYLLRNLAKERRILFTIVFLNLDMRFDNLVGLLDVWKSQLENPNWRFDISVFYNYNILNVVGLRALLIG
jgi:hypothetical protein